MGLFSRFCVSALRCTANEYLRRVRDTGVDAQSSHDLPPLRASFKFDHVPSSRGLNGPAGRRRHENKITGRSAFLALLKDEGVTHLFGNPGTTELPIMHALKDHPDLTYVMAMQESLVVAMADGFQPRLGQAGRLQRSCRARARQRDGLALQRKLHRHPLDPDRWPAGAGPRSDGAGALRPAGADGRSRW